MNKQGGADKHEDVAVAGLNTEDASIGGYKAWAVDIDSAERLWSLSEELLGEQFPL